MATELIGGQGPSSHRAPHLPDPRDLMVHCAQEMNHLAGFLPALFERFAGV